MKKLIYKQIQNIIRLLIETSFIPSYNFPSDKDNRITWSGYKDISFALKNIAYEELYDECIKEKAYNFILIDGAVVQLMYEFNGNEIIKQRLAFYPKPNFERFQDSAEDYEDVYYGNQLFSDIYDKKVVAFPIRIDFDIDKEKYIEHDHSFAHLTLGNYKNCRIPVNKPLSPNKFILFILRGFYFDRFNAYYKNDDFKCTLDLEELLTVDEKKLFHINH